MYFISKQEENFVLNNKLTNNGCTEKDRNREGCEEVYVKLHAYIISLSTIVSIIRMFPAYNMKPSSCLLQPKWMFVSEFTCRLAYHVALLISRANAKDYFLILPPFLNICLFRDFQIITTYGAK